MLYPPPGTCYAEGAILKSVNYPRKPKPNNTSQKKQFTSPEERASDFPTWKVLCGRCYTKISNYPRKPKPNNTSQKKQFTLPEERVSDERAKLDF